MTINLVFTDSSAPNATLVFGADAVISSDVNVSISGNTVTTSYFDLNQSLSKTVGISGTPISIEYGLLDEQLEEYKNVSGNEITLCHGEVQKNLEISLNGNSTILRTGNFGISSIVAVSGKQISSSVGNVNKSISIDIGGNSTTIDFGVVVKQTSIILHGHQLNTSIGLVGKRVYVDVFGQQIITENGLVDRMLSVAILGKIATVVSGNLSIPSSVIVLNGLSSNVYCGIVSAIIDEQAIVEITGNSLSTQVGDLVDAGNYSVVDITGGSISTQLGEAQFADLAEIFGSNIVSDIGNVSIKVYPPDNVGRVYLPTRLLFNDDRTPSTELIFGEFDFVSSTEAILNPVSIISSIGTLSIELKLKKTLLHTTTINSLIGTFVIDVLPPDDGALFVFGVTKAPSVLSSINDTLSSVNNFYDKPTSLLFDVPSMSNNTGIIILNSANSQLIRY